MSGFVYILTNTHNTVLYVGVTANLLQRLQQHRDGVDPKAFSRRYNLWKLVYFEHFASMREAIEREKHLKNYRRARKCQLIERMNPSWKDLTEEVFKAGYF